MKAVILVGGRGSRLSDVSGGMPKALVPVAGVPVLARQFEMLRREGIRDVILVCGYLSEQIRAYCGDGSDFGISIEYYIESEPLGTGGALFRLGLREDFLLLNGDLVFDVDLRSMTAFHTQRNALATLFAHPSAHPADSTLLCADADGSVKAFLPAGERRGDAHNLTNAGIAILSPLLLVTGRADLDRDVLRPNTDGLFAYRSAEYVKDMGTPERLREVERDLARDLPQKRQKNRPRSAVFLDRDGTLNVHKGYITSPEELELLPGAAEAVRRINQSGLLAVLVTNQPVVARGECTLPQLERIHCRLETLLGEGGAFLDGLYFCPHHPDKGFAGEDVRFKIDCDCRKPKPGLIERAAKELHIDVQSSFMVGDTMIDVLTARSAGCVPVLLTDGEADADVRVFPDLLSFAGTL